MNSLLASTFKLGGDASIAVGPVGSGAKSDNRRLRECGRFAGH